MDRGFRRLQRWSRLFDWCMNKTAKSFSKLFKKSRKRLEYFVEGAILEFTEAVVVRMEQTGISESELASKLKRKPVYVKNVLRGRNFSLESMVKIGLALDSELSIKLVPKASVSQTDLQSRGRGDRNGM
jgi:ribosome-binding protein aMBF1 (putative translation factor)